MTTLFNSRHRKKLLTSLQVTVGQYNRGGAVLFLTCTIGALTACDKSRQSHSVHVFRFKRSRNTTEIAPNNGQPIQGSAVIFRICRRIAVSSGENSLFADFTPPFFQVMVMYMHACVVSLTGHSALGNWEWGGVMCLKKGQQIVRSNDDISQYVYICLRVISKHSYYTPTHRNDSNASQAQGNWHR